MYPLHTPIEQSFEEFKEKAAAGKLENFCWVEPDYQELESDDHPPHDTLNAQRLIAQTYNALIKNKEAWNNTLFIVTYDEHGGFFDPIPPPPAVVPDERSTADPAFASLGVRVPSVIISPRISQGIDSTTYDHTSVLKYVLDKWAPNSNLGQRVANATPIKVDLATPRGGFESIPVPAGGAFTSVTASGIQPEDEETLIGQDQDQDDFMLAFEKHVTELCAKHCPENTMMPEKIKSYCGDNGAENREEIDFNSADGRYMEKIIQAAYAQTKLDRSSDDMNDLQKTLCRMMCYIPPRQDVP